ncbi:hypothetical protein CPB86DRAFT_823681 [Serendipita vermifera]|nr:hypothetical protein CPB86DRAFT_823681 [Serendipita vermifera]
MEYKRSTSVDTILLAKRMTEILGRPFTSARMLDRGAYAAVYHLIEPVSSSSAHGLGPVVVRVSSRPAYNDVAIDQERQKILHFVGTLNYIQGLAPKQVLRRIPKVLAYDASSSTEFGYGWIAMSRVPGTPLSDCWVEFTSDQRAKVIKELASFTRKLARFTSSEQIGSIATMACTSQASTSKASSHFDYKTGALSLPRRNGANNLRPFAMPKSSQTTHSTTASFLADAVEAEIAFLRTHQKSALRCFNMNILRMHQCGMDDEVPADLAFASTTSNTYRKQLKALGDLAKSVVNGVRARNMSTPEQFSMAHLDLTPDNILVDPETAAVVGIVDWEFSGFVPEWIALAPPTWITDEWLPSWTGNEWQLDGDECERNPFGELRQETELVKEMRRSQRDILRFLWEEEVAWDDVTRDISRPETIEKRKAWKACLGEWYRLERACAWARGVVSTRNQRVVIDLGDTDDERSTDGSFYHGARCPSPSTAESSTGPYTPVDAVPTMELPFVSSGHEQNKPSLLMRQGDLDSDESDYEDEDEEDEEENEVFMDDLEFEEFAASFAPAPIPHTTPHSPFMSSPFTPPSLSSPPNLVVTMTTSSEGSQQQATLLALINSKSPPANLPKDSLWTSFWETPQFDVTRDLEFIVERDLDAGW